MNFSKLVIDFLPFNSPIINSLTHLLIYKGLSGLWLTYDGLLQLSAGLWCTLQSFRSTMKGFQSFRSPMKDSLTSQLIHNDSMDVSSLIMDSKIFRPAYNRLPAFSPAFSLDYKSHSVLSFLVFRKPMINFQLDNCWFSGPQLAYSRLLCLSARL